MAEKQKFTLAPEQETRLRSRLRQPDSLAVHRRGMALLAIHNGCSPAVVSAVLEVSRQTIYNWISGCDPGQSDLELADAARSGRPRIAGGELDLLLEQALQLPPVEGGCEAARWTTGRLRDYVFRKRQLEVSDETIRRRLRELNYYWSKGGFVRARQPE